MKSKSEQWIDAYKWSSGKLDIPTCVDRVIQKEYEKAIKKHEKK